MSLSEFDIIQRYFSDIGCSRDDVRLGVGDDCALLTYPPDMDMVVTVDNLVLDVHFDKSTPVESVGYKAVMVSVSDIAAMGARPAWLNLALTLPEVNENWLQAFSGGLSAACLEANVSLVGGNISSGPLNIATQLIGNVKTGAALARSGATIGQGIFVTGNLGDAGLGFLSHRQRLNGIDEQGYQKAKSDVLERFYRPVARVDIGLELQAIATSCIDISDGFAADLGHILSASDVGATVELEQLPVHNVFHSVFDQVGQWAHPLTAGEDYELCFTALPQYTGQIQQISRDHNVSITQVGIIDKQPGLRFTLGGAKYTLNKSSGHQHM